MLYISIEDFFEKASSCVVLNRQEEKAVDTFDFLQDSEPYSHRLNWALRQAVVKYIVK